MPKQYERIKESLLKRGYGSKEAKRIAAATYNKQHPGHPMRPHRKRKSSMPRANKFGYY